MKERIAIIDGIRTPFGKAGGALKTMDADDLGAYACRELLARMDFPIDQLDEAILGNVSQPIHAANVARVIALKAGLPNSLPSYTVHRNCASGMESITTAANKILAGEAQTALCGGAESMSNIPLYYGPQMVELFANLFKAKTLGQKLAVVSKFRPRFLTPIIGVQLGLTDPVCGLNMGLTAENLAREFKISREEQDAFALESHQKACAAQGAGRLAEEIISIPVGPKFKTTHEADEGPRKEQTIEALAKLKPYFDRKTGTVTVGNACPITDGAVALMVASESKAKELGYEPLGYLRAYAYAGLEGSRMGLGPVYATAKLLDKTGLSMKDFQLVELNEAFSAQVIANERAFDSAAFAKKYLNRNDAVGAIDHASLNVNGGAVALGHPVGATGARLVLTILKELRRRGQNRGLATLCIGGGQGAALALEVA